MKNKKQALLIYLLLVIANSLFAQLNKSSCEAILNSRQCDIHIVQNTINYDYNSVTKNALELIFNEEYLIIKRKSRDREYDREYFIPYDKIKCIQYHSSTQHNTSPTQYYNGFNIYLLN